MSLWSLATKLFDKLFKKLFKKLGNRTCAIDLPLCRSGRNSGKVQYIKRNFFSLSEIGNRGGLDRSFPENGNHICFGSGLSLQTENKQWEF